MKNALCGPRLRLRGTNLGEVLLRDQGAELPGRRHALDVAHARRVLGSRQVPSALLCGVCDLKGVLAVMKRVSVAFKGI